MTPEDKERLRQRAADIQKRLEKLIPQEEEKEVVDREGQAAVVKTTLPLGRTPGQRAGAEWSHIPLRGIRSFQLKESGGDLYLTGLAYPLPWTPGVNESVCGHAERYRDVVSAANPFAAMMNPFRRYLSVGYDQPHSLRDCSHGYYSLLDLNHFSSYNGRGNLHGMIEGWGEVIAGPDGFRCEKAKIVALVLPNATGALDTIEEEEKKKNPEPTKEKKERDPLDPPRGVKWFYKHEAFDAIAAVSSLFGILFFSVGAFQNMPWTLPILLGVPPFAFIGWSAWAASFSSKWGIGSPYWQTQMYPPELLNFLHNGGVQPGANIAIDMSNRLAETYGVPCYKSVDAMLERHPIERGEA